MNAQVPSSERLHIVLAGACNSGKSSLLNALCRQSVAIVSPTAGTTTDPVRKPIELPGVGACVIVDTPGINDTTELGELRTVRSRDEFERADIIIVLLEPDNVAANSALIQSISTCAAAKIAVMNRSDEIYNHDVAAATLSAAIGSEVTALSALTGEGIDRLLERIAAESARDEATITGDFVKAGNTVVLVMPQDKQAPKGRLILPQVQTLRELLDKGCNALCCTPEGLPAAIAGLKHNPDLVITDSQVFPAVAKAIPADCRLTSFSVLMAAYKGDLELFVNGVKALDGLTSASRVLIAEACSHVPQNEDIGRVKIPRLLHSRVGDGLTIDFCNGADFPENLADYDLIVHCGGCMFTRRHILSRLRRASAAGVPVTNYGILLAALSGILPRVTLPR